MRDTPVKTIMIYLTAEDMKLSEEITLTGVISGKIAKGDYMDDPDRTQLQQAYDSCHKVNEGLHKKLNRVRRALSADELQTERPEDELE